MKTFGASTLALAAMTSVALAEAPTATSSPSAGPLRLTDGQMDQVKAGSQSCDVTSACVRIFVDSTLVEHGPPRTCEETLILCNNNNQQSQGGSNRVGDFSLGDVNVTLNF